MRRIPPLLSLLAATLLLMSVAFADGRPSVFYDSHSYDAMGQDLIQTVRDWPQSNHNKSSAGFKSVKDGPVPADALLNIQVEGARSPFYGVLLHAAWMFTTIWALAALQSLLAAWVCYLLWRTLAPKAPSWSYLAVMAFAAAGTSISFYTTFAMPDIFAGIGGAAVVLILAQGDRLKKLEIAGLWAVIVYAMAIHKSHWATGLAVAFVGGGLLWILGLSTQSVVRRVMVVVSAAVVAWMAGVAFDQVFENRTGYKLGHPPFLTARVLADGPGVAYLNKACAETARGGAQPYVLCRFQTNVRTSAGLKVSRELTSNVILWYSSDRADRKNWGVFNRASWKERWGLEAEEMRFVLGTLKYDPVGLGAAALRDWGDQLVAFQVIDPLRNPSDYLIGKYWPTTTLPKMIPNFQACRPPGSCKPPFNDDVLAVWQGTVLVASLLILAVRLCLGDIRRAVWRRGLKDGQEPARVAATMVLLAAVILANAAICGILSGPFARYQARLIWLLPVGLGLTACALPMGLERLLPFARRAWDLVVGLWERVRAQPVIGRFLPPLDGHFMRFCCVGLLGFVVDFSVLTSIVDLGVNKIGGKFVSFAVAVVATWLVNRLWTFRAHEGPKRSLAREFGSYLTVQSVGFAANFSVYSALIYAAPVKNEHLQLLLGSVAGTAAGLMINYLGAKHLVFRRRARAS